MNFKSLGFKFLRLFEEIPFSFILQSLILIVFIFLSLSIINFFSFIFFVNAILIVIRAIFFLTNSKNMYLIKNILF